jgi:predicted ATP-binding protein involved in virulence
MWVEELTLENIKCFEKMSIRFGTEEQPHKWISLLGENGGGKSTILQALSLMLAGYEGAIKLLNSPKGWVRNENEPAKISIRIHQDANDIGQFGKEKTRTAFGYTFFVTGSQKISIRNKVYTEPSIVENPDKILSWLRENALTSKGKTWFAAGYGAFRRLTRKSEIIVPSLQTPERYTNFISQFYEDEPLAAFERWLVYLDYRMAKNNDKTAEHQKVLGIEAINKMLPRGNSFDSVTSDGRILFDVKGKKVPTIGLSDGFRSVLALAGDLVWRLLEAFPESENPLLECGVVLIDELDIHLHPTWQREIAGWLQMQFPNIQFIVATHSPLIVAGAGADAITYKFDFDGDKSVKNEVKDLAFLSVENILCSSAFKIVSPYSDQTQEQLDKYFKLKAKEKRTAAEEKELKKATSFAQKANREVNENSLEFEIQQFLDEKLKK